MKCFFLFYENISITLVVPMPSNELKTDFFGLSTSSSSAAAANPTSFLPPPISHDLSDYASSLMMPPPPPPPPLASNYGHMKMVNYLLFF
jgi:hypothetical protein